mmetsp:Transcript_23124/g.59431  ORF Transcript_23124/g.59431 Transcript_23124/m.59431 type:complete len:119 (-) Transcript_23124:80-436(-)
MLRKQDGTTLLAHASHVELAPAPLQLGAAGIVPLGSTVRIHAHGGMPEMRGVVLRSHPANIASTYAQYTVRRDDSSTMDLTSAQFELATVGERELSAEEHVHTSTDTSLSLYDVSGRG